MRTEILSTAAMRAAAAAFSSWCCSSSSGDSLMPGITIGPMLVFSRWGWLRRWIKSWRYRVETAILTATGSDAITFPSHTDSELDPSVDNEISDRFSGNDRGPSLFVIPRPISEQLFHCCSCWGGKKLGLIRLCIAGESAPPPRPSTEVKFLLVLYMK